MHQVRLAPGTPISGEPNDQYPLDQILNQRAFYSQDARVLPHEFTRRQHEWTPGVTNAWIEYVPQSYTGQEKVPLVLSLHGGSQTARHQLYETAWIDVAERENVIVVCPDASHNRLWESAAPLRQPDPEGHDMRFLLGLLNELPHRYAIDETRVYIHGMSLGARMAALFTRLYGERLAGAAFSMGPLAPQILFSGNGQPFLPQTPVPVYIETGEYDLLMNQAARGYDGKGTRCDNNLANLRYWQTVNGCSPQPRFSMQGNENLVWYEGDVADVICQDTRQRGHGQTFDNAEHVWARLFSRYRREGGRLIRASRLSLEDSVCLLADGCKKVYRGGEIIAMPQPAVWVEDPFETPRLQAPGYCFDAFPAMRFDPSLYVPASALPLLLPVHAECITADTARLRLPDKRDVRVSAGNTGCVVDNHVVSMPRHALQQNGQLLVPLQWFAQYFFNMHVSMAEGVMSLSHRQALLSHDMTRMVQNALGEEDER